MDIPLVTRKGAMFVIKTELLPSNCNKIEIINSLYDYMATKYAHTKGKHSLADINKDLNDLLKREGLI